MKVVPPSRRFQVMTTSGLSKASRYASILGVVLLFGFLLFSLWTWQQIALELQGPSPAWLILAALSAWSARRQASGGLSAGSAARRHGREHVTIAILEDRGPRRTSAD
jgi:hypothetical protein